MAMRIADYIPTGAENAISMKALAGIVGLPPRDLRREIFAARKRGEPICSLCDEEKGGYFMPNPENPSDAARYIRMQTTRIRSANDALRGVRKFIRQCGGEL